MRNIIIILVVIVLIVGVLALFKSRQFTLPSGDTVPFDSQSSDATDVEIKTEDTEDTTVGDASPVLDSLPLAVSQRQVFITDGTKHSIPLDEILSGGPGKDGIPSIDNPKFTSIKEASFLEDIDPGIGLTVGGESRFYPYRILVWHEIVNDTIADQPVLVTYCPLCATGIVFDRRVDGVEQEFGVSGMLWQSNLLMYNRASSEDNESLWSQVLGEAVLGVNTGERLPIIRSNIIRFGQWKESHPDTKVLSLDTGTSRDYSRDPYGNYYTSDSVSFGASFSDERLHPKALVHGVEINGQFKAYHDDAVKLNTGVINDTFAGQEITITVQETGEISFEADGDPLASIPGFWFSWVAVHPDTELFQ